MSYAESNAFARAVCGLKPVPAVIKAPINLPNMAIDMSLLKGLYEYAYESPTGLFIDCYLVYEEEHDGGNPANPDSEESWPKSITLTHALVNGVNIVGVLSEDTLATIETEALASLATDAFDRDCDDGEDRWNDREAA
jgi:hypothetical protein